MLSKSFMALQVVRHVYIIITHRSKLEPTYLCFFFGLIDNGNIVETLAQSLNFTEPAKFKKMTWVVSSHRELVFRWIYFFENRKQPKTFAFDHCLYSVDLSHENYASQEVVFDCLGRDILDNAFQGYNACIFAYGQTGKAFFLIYMSIKTR